jgi:two-component system osmolarity sensor histidine kinase EnvZ
MQIFHFQSYFWKILSTIGIVSIGFMLIVLSTIAYYMVVPLGQRATDDLASIIFHAAETWEKLPREKRSAFVLQMQTKHHLTVTEKAHDLPVSTSVLPYLYFLESSLKKQLGQKINLKTSVGSNGEEWYWADIPLPDSILSFGFPRSRIGVKPSVAFAVLLITGFFLTFITATLLTRRLTTTIERLYQAAKQIGKGQWPEPVPEKGPEELVVLAREFNRMNIQVKELLASRTTLLAGISHDLRTPLTQIQLALAMLPDEGGDAELMQGVQRDLESVNHLIGQALEVNMELDDQDQQSIQISETLDHIIDYARRGTQEINWHAAKKCCFMLNKLAFQRIVSNLLENAIRYGEGKPITIECYCEKGFLTLEVIDQGPGIPAEQREAVFQPFFRLESSRSSETGGSGLGLAIVRQLASLNGWAVQLLEVADGGTCARLVMPVSGSSDSQCCK